MRAAGGFLFPAGAAVKKAGRSPVYVGKVERVYPRHNYVLIALAGTVYEPGTVLISQSAGSGENRRVANLIVTEERMGAHAHSGGHTQRHGGSGRLGVPVPESGRAGKLRKNG